jgi:hypothetical protein
VARILNRGTIERCFMQRSPLPEMDSGGREALLHFLES